MKKLFIFLCLALGFQLSANAQNQYGNGQQSSSDSTNQQIWQAAADRQRNRMMQEYIANKSRDSLRYANRANGRNTQQVNTNPAPVQVQQVNMN
jgi:hypothetical protein